MGVIPDNRSLLERCVGRIQVSRVSREGEMLAHVLAHSLCVQSP